MKLTKYILYGAVFAAVSAGGIIAPTAHAAPYASQSPISSNGNDVLFNAKDDSPPPPRPGPRDGGADN